MIPYGRQDISKADIDAVVEVLRSAFLTQGPAVPAFERVLAERCGVPHAIAVNSATSALHIACLALGVGPGDVVWTSPITFVASANCARYCGADVDFVDIDARTYNMSAAALRSKLERASAAGRLPKLVIPVHMTGQSPDMAEIRAMADQYGVRVVEDASHSVGGTYRDQPIGNCRFSDITVFSFHPVKIITTGEGGMLMTRDGGLAERLRRLRAHGITREPAHMTRPAEGEWYYEQVELGYNYRMTDIQAALGLSQASRLDAFLARRRALAARYDTLLHDLPLTLPYQMPGGCSAWHLYVVRLQQDRVRRTRAEVFRDLRARGIGVNVHYIPVPRQPYYADLGFDAARWPEAERYYEEAISIPLHAGLTDAEQDRVVAALGDALRGP